jgi:hypothetical protein
MIQQRLDSIRWKYLDPTAKAEMTRRISVIGRSEDGLLTYSNVVNGVTFRLSNTIA